MTPAQARYAALVVEADSERVLFAEHANQFRYPASLTKMMTLYMVFEALERKTLTLDQRLPVSAQAAAQPPSKLGLQVGDTITVQEAIFALVTRSANDVATVVAEALGQTEAHFGRQMTRRAHALGMRQTTFRNASGLPDPHQMTTAWDMLRLAKALQHDFPQYYHYFSTPDFYFQGTTHRNHNRLLGNYQGTNGIKTGYIRASGFNLVSSVHRDGHKIIGIVFGGDSAVARDEHMRALLDQGFTQLASAPAPNQVYADRSRSPVSGSRMVATMEQGSTDSQSNAGAYEPRWKVQVGVFSRLTDAERHASRVLQAVPDMLLQEQKTIVPLSNRSGKTLYRTRFQGLTRLEATTVCQTLQQRQIDCLALSPAS